MNILSRPAINLEQLRKYLSPSIIDLGFILSKCILRRNKRKKIVVFYIKKPDHSLVSIDDCVMLTHQIRTVLKINPDMPDHTDLEVSSAAESS